LITLAMATEISTPRCAVWSAISDPEQERHWRPGVSERLEDRTADDHAFVRYRVRLHDVPVVLEKRQIERIRHEELRSELRLGLFRIEEAFALFALSPTRTRLALKIIAPNQMPVVGGRLDRFDVRRFAMDLSAVNLQAVRDWCERGQAPRLELPDFPSSQSLLGA
jgi:hypothetical protein